MVAVSFYDMAQEFGWSTALRFTGTVALVSLTAYLVATRRLSKRRRDEDSDSLP